MARKSNSRRRYTPMQKAWAKERKRIKDFIRRAEKRGYVFPDFKMPDMPKRVTQASLRRMRRYNAEYFYKHGYAVNRDTGELTNAVEERAKRRKASAVKAAVTKAVKKMFSRIPFVQNLPQPTTQTEPVRPVQSTSFYEIAIANIKNEWRAYSGLPGYRKMIDWLDESVRRYGAKAVVEGINEAEQNGEVAAYDSFYTDDSAGAYIARVMTYFDEVVTASERTEMYESTADYTEVYDAY